MTGVLRPTLLVAALFLLGCSGEPDGPPPAPKADAAEHPDARFLVDYGGNPFRVIVRYVPLIEESVIAVQKGHGDGTSPEWRSLVVPANPSFDPGLNFADGAYETYAIEIARAVQAEGGICEQGQDIDMATDADGDVRTTFRRNRKVWVVFALCPERVTS